MSFERKIINQDLFHSPLVSVIIPTYNRAGVVKRAVDSVLKQDYHNFEILVIDDGSTDATPLLFSEMKDERLRFIRLGKNVGGAQARNEGLYRARGEFIAFLDSDDEWFPAKLSRQLCKFSELPEEFGLVYCGSLVIDKNGMPTGKYIRNAAGFFLEDLLVKNVIGTTSSIMVKKKFLDHVKGFDPLMKSCQDWELYIRLMKICPFHFVDEVLIRYYINKDDPARISNRVNSVLNGHIRLLEKFKKDYDRLPLEKRILHAKLMTQMFADVGDLKHTISYLKQAVAGESAWRIWIKRIWYFAKCLRNKIRKKTNF